MSRVYACLSISCHLHFFTESRPGSFLCHCRNTGLKQTPNKIQHRKLTLGRKKSPAAPSGFEPATSVPMTSPTLYQLIYPDPPSPPKTINWNTHKWKCAVFNKKKYIYKKIKVNFFLFLTLPTKRYWMIKLTHDTPCWIGGNQTRCSCFPRCHPHHWKMKKKKEKKKERKN